MRSSEWNQFWVFTHVYWFSSSSVLGLYAYFTDSLPSGTMKYQMVYVTSSTSRYSFPFKKSVQEWTRQIILYYTLGWISAYRTQMLKTGFGNEGYYEKRQIFHIQMPITWVPRTAAVFMIVNGRLAEYALFRNLSDCVRNEQKPEIMNFQLAFKYFCRLHCLRLLHKLVKCLSYSHCLSCSLKIVRLVRFAKKRLLKLQHAMLMLLACAHVRFHWSLEVYEERIHFVFKVCTTHLFIFLSAVYFALFYLHFSYFTKSCMKLDLYDQCVMCRMELPEWILQLSSLFCRLKLLSFVGSIIVRVSTYSPFVSYKLWHQLRSCTQHTQ